MFDPSAVVPKLFESLLESATRRTIKSVSGGAAKFVDMLRMNFSDYLFSAIDRTSHVKTLLHRDAPVNLFSIYVETFLKSGSTVIRDEILIERCRKSASIFVIGSAGSGKTMFVRYLFLHLIEGGFGIIPIFVELRALNLPEYKDDLVQFMYDTVVRPGAVVTKEQFRYCLRSNLFTLIFDGLDEVEHDRRPGVERQIMNLRESYPKLGIVISSRPDDRVSGWPAFTMYHIEPMKKTQVKKVISRLPYEPKLRAKFIREIDKDLYQKHASFLSNPLLATMMLMTYDQFAYIPEKIHIFYEQAFETLFFRHDAGKDAAFRRKMYTALAINDFKNCLSAMCASSYFKEKFQFGEAEILEFIKKAAQSEQVEISKDDYLRDLLESVCVLQRDGLFVSFTHRSFQEYFAAFFLSRSPATPIGDLCDAFSGRREDNVIAMAFEMNRLLIEREWILPRIRTLADVLLRADENGDELSVYAESVYELIELGFLGEGPRPKIQVEVSPWRNAFMRVISRLYPTVFEETAYSGFSDDECKMIGDKLMPGYDTYKYAKFKKIVAESLWLMETSFSKFVRRERELVLALKTDIEKSVGQQKILENALFN